MKAKCPELCVYEKKYNQPLMPATFPALKSTVAEPIWVEHIEEHFEPQSTSNLSDALLTPISGPATLCSPNPQLILEGNNLLIGVNPLVRSTDMINLHMDLSTMPPEGVTPSSNDFSNISFRCMRNTTRTISLVEVSQQEPGAKLFWKFNDRVKKLKLMTLQNFPDHQLRSELLAAAKRRFGNKFIDLYPHALTNISSNAEVKKVFSDYGVSIGLSFTDSLDFVEGDSYAGALKSLLPLRDALLGYISRFFREVYPMYPVVDEDWLTDNIDRLLVYSSTGSELLEVQISSKDDLTIFALLLFILRLAYLSYFTNSLVRNEVIVNEPRAWGLLLAESQITVSAVDLAMKLLHAGRFRKKALFLGLQAHLLCAVTRMYALENEMSLNIIDTECNVGQLLQMAISLTMDRDPDLVHDNLPTDEKSKNLRRKVWFVLVHLDLMMSYTFFSPRCIMTSQYNTRLPTYTVGGCNIGDHKIEEETIRLITDIHGILTCGSDLLDICLDMKNSYRVVDVICKLNDFENLVSDRLGSTQKYFRDDTARVYSSFTLTLLQLQTQVTLKLFMANIYYFLHLYYNYKKDQELDFFFFRKLILILFTEMNIFCSELMFTPHLMAEPSFNLFMSPVILVYLHVVAMVGLGFAIRLYCTGFLLERSGENNVSLKVIQNLTSRNEAFILRKLKLGKLLSERYFYGWKCTKANGFGYKMIYEKRLYSADLEALTNAKICWSERQQLELSNLIPEDVPIQMSDVGDVRLHCYYSNRSLNDADLRGPDLCKTIQTDNFWIVFNSISDRDPYAASVSKESLATRPLQGPSERSFAELGDIGNDENAQFGHTSGGVISAHSIPNDSPNLIFPVANDILDFNFFSTDWTIDEFCPLKS